MRRSFASASCMAMRFPVRLRTLNGPMRRAFGDGENHSGCAARRWPATEHATVPTPRISRDQRLRKMDLHRLAWRVRFAAIGKAVDLLCLMTYDQKTRWTTPGPSLAGNGRRQPQLRAAGGAEGEAFARHSSLRLYWYHGARDLTPAVRERGTAIEKPNPTADYISAVDALQLAHDWNGKISGTTRITPRGSTLSRTRCANGFSIRICVRFGIAMIWRSAMGSRLLSWVLGEEDPAIWTFLPNDNNSRRIADERNPSQQASLQRKK